MKHENLIRVFEGEDLANLADFLNLKYEKMLNGKEYYMLIIRSKFRVNVRRINTRILSDKIYSFLKNETDVIEHSGKRYSVAKTDFKANGYNVYCVYQEGDSVPCMLYRALEHYNPATQQIAVCSYYVQVDKDLETFRNFFSENA